MYLAYAEAANEAWGPTEDNGHGYSAYDVIKAIRKRAGVGGESDPYLENVCKGSKDKMRELIRNERRLELCFEGFRFWDLRRWKEDLNETVWAVSYTHLRSSRPSAFAQVYLIITIDYALSLIHILGVTLFTISP